MKAIWEPSRFNWVADLCRTFERNTPLINRWLSDWCRSNPAFTGPNWKCGQEASFRVLNLAIAGVLRGDRRPTRSLAALLWNHLARIAPTFAYAAAQDNNHGTSEAAAMFVGGTLLLADYEIDAARWAAQGRAQLEERVARLIAVDGSFSQHSVNYHRLMLDTLSIAEIWRRFTDQQPFSEAFRRKAALATEWLRHMVDTSSGDAPNIGGNDGAQLLFRNAGYRDFRPSLELATDLFRRDVLTPPAVLLSEWRHRLQTEPSNSSALFDAGGFAVLGRRSSKAVVRYPRFRFRPADADALHVDLWSRGENLLRDAGTFSYAAAPEVRAAFSGVAGHNTIAFDRHDQMPRLGPFLWSEWPETLERTAIQESALAVHFSAAYEDYCGCRHRRSVSLTDHAMDVTDQVAGFKERAVLRWRLRPMAATAEGFTVRSGDDVLTVTASMPIARFEIVPGAESRYYMQQTSCPVLEVEVRDPGTIRTNYAIAG
jgi:hypothetical protein